MRLTTMVLMVAALTLAATMTSAPRAAGMPIPAAAPAVVAQSQQPPERSVVGTLDHVDVSGSEFAVMTSAGKQSFHLQAGATIRQGSKTMKPAELAAHKGERVKVRYRESGGIRRAEWIVLASPPARRGDPKNS